MGDGAGTADGLGIGDTTVGLLGATGGSSANVELNLTLVTANGYLFSFNGLSDSGQFFIDGSSAPDAFIRSDIFTADSIGGSTNPIDGRLQELIIYSSDQSANRTAIETNINDHYNIY